MVALRFLLRRDARYCSRISVATVFLLTRQPASRRSAAIRGDPYLPSRAANSRATSAFSRCLRSARGSSWPSLCLQNQALEIPSARHDTATGMPSALRAAISAATATAPSRP